LTKSVEQFGRDYYKRLFAIGNLFLPISNRWKDRLIDLGCPKEKIEVHRMGIDLNKFYPSSRRFRKGRRLKILTVGRLVEKKGIEYGIRAVREAMNAYPEIEYTIVGDGPLKESLAVVIKKLSLGRSVRMVGWKSHNEVKRLMMASDLLLCPSVTSSDGDQEGLPVVLMEAMACGLPVISTFHSGIPELVDDSKTGFLVPERSAGEIAEKIRLLVNNPDIMKVSGAKAREHVKKFYDIEMLNRRLANLYKTC
jgi:colanic acid/amylovoran biosynthesis glycosyltransferase